MKQLLCLASVLCLLCGCTADIPEHTTLPTESTIQETSPCTIETVLPTETDPVELDTAQTLLASMTLQQRVGQLFLARCPVSNAVQDIETYHLGGFVLFSRDFDGETPDSIHKTIESYQSAASIPMLIAVDEEGGTVTRVSRYSAFRERPFPSPRKLYSEGGLEYVISTEQEKSLLLHGLGINVNLGPVCDITTEKGAFMYDRSLGQDPEITADFVRSVVDVMTENGIGSVLKHFPGYGNNTDTHVGIAVDERTLEELESNDLVPFQAGIAANCGAIMVSHVFINAIDPNIPATLSPSVHTYLREVMDFDGVIVTDDLSMEAITDLYGVGEAAVLAVLAGNDLLCVTEHTVQYNAVLQAVEEGRISEEQINEAVLRVLRWKIELGLL